MRRPVYSFPSILTFLLFVGVHGREPVQYQISRHDSSIKDTCSYMEAPLSHMLRSIPGLNSSSVSSRDDAMQGCMCASSVRKYLAFSNPDEMDVKTLERVMEAYIVESPGAKHCSYPPHATAQCTQDDPCGFSCSDGFQLSSFDFRGKKTSACTCPAPNSICDGQCGDFPGGCASKTTKDNRAFRLHKEVGRSPAVPSARALAGRSPRPSARALAGRSPRPSARAVRRQSQPSAGPSPQPSAAFQSYTPAPTNSFSSAQAQQAQDAGCEPNETLCGAYAPRGRSATECVDTQNSLESCGGCMVAPPRLFIRYDFDYDDEYTKRQAPMGVDCSSLDGVSDVSCSMGRCNVQSCESGWKVAPSGDHCVPESSGGVPASMPPSSTTSSMASPTSGPEPTTTDAPSAPAPSSQFSGAQSGADEQSTSEPASSDGDSDSSGPDSSDTNGNGNGVGNVVENMDIASSCGGSDSAVVNVGLCLNGTVGGSMIGNNASASPFADSEAASNVTDVQGSADSVTGTTIDTSNEGANSNLRNVGGPNSIPPPEGPNIQDGDVILPAKTGTRPSSLPANSLPNQLGNSASGTAGSDNMPDVTDN